MGFCLGLSFFSWSGGPLRELWNGLGMKFRAGHVLVEELIPFRRIQSRFRIIDPVWNLLILFLIYWSSFPLFDPPCRIFSKMYICVRPHDQPLSHLRQQAETWLLKQPIFGYKCFGHTVSTFEHKVTLDCLFLAGVGFWTGAVGRIKGKSMIEHAFMEELIPFQ